MPLKQQKERRTTLGDYFNSSASPKSYRFDGRGRSYQVTIESGVNKKLKVTVCNEAIKNYSLAKRAVTAVKDFFVRLFTRDMSAFQTCANQLKQRVKQQILSDFRRAYTESFKANLWNISADVNLQAVSSLCQEKNKAAAYKVALYAFTYGQSNHQINNFLEAFYNKLVSRAKLSANNSVQRAEYEKLKADLSREELFENVWKHNPNQNRAHKVVHKVATEVDFVEHRMAAREHIEHAKKHNAKAQHFERLATYISTNNKNAMMELFPEQKLQGMVIGALEAQSKIDRVY
ncbi:hypothetical protein [Endozoicomonas ascidiicola]|uniref:hypothetical protein n=1 Tax=Endozoicomonas ascidiicola TaxID=1698521 RepID=UPI0008308408|nr:hypothetical protein [Endozoicomonas ascidiicola]